MIEVGSRNKNDRHQSNILLVSGDQEGLAGLAGGLRKDEQITMHFVKSGREAMETIKTSAIEVVIADERLADIDGLAFIKEVAAQQPFINSVLVSALEPDEFHEETEGLGVLMQLTPVPDEQQAGVLLSKLEKLRTLSAV